MGFSAVQPAAPAARLARRPFPSCAAMGPIASANPASSGFAPPLSTPGAASDGPTAVLVHSWCGRWFRREALVGGPAGCPVPIQGGHLPAGRLGRLLPASAAVLSLSMICPASRFRPQAALRHAGFPGGTGPLRLVKGSSDPRQPPTVYPHFSQGISPPLKLTVREPVSDLFLLRQKSG